MRPAHEPLSVVLRADRVGRQESGGRRKGGTTGAIAVVVPCGSRIAAWDEATRQVQLFGGF